MAFNESFNNSKKLNCKIGNQYSLEKRKIKPIKKKPNRISQYKLIQIVIDVLRFLIYLSRFYSLWFYF